MSYKGIFKYNFDSLEVEKKYIKTNSLRKIANFFGCSHETMRCFMLRNNISFKKEINFQKVKELFEKGYGRDKIAQICNCHKETVRRILKRHNISIPRKYKYSCDTNFFENWSPEMAYVLGFIYADGYLCDQYFGIPQKEFSILNKIRNLLKSNHRIYKTKKSQFVFRVYNRKIIEDLKKLGVHQRKSSTIKFPLVPQDYIFHFIRGYFDGDGSIDNRGVSIASCSLSFLKAIQKILTSFYGFFLHKIGIQNNKRRFCFILYYSTRGEQLALFKYFYDKYTIENELFLKRKFLKYKETLTQLNEKKEKCPFRTEKCPYCGTWTSSQNKQFHFQNCPAKNLSLDNTQKICYNYE